MSSYAHNIIISKLFELDIVKKGDFTLKSGIKSSVYFDFRKLLTYPSVLSQVCDLFTENFRHIFEQQSKKSKRSIRITGVPYGGLNLASFLSAKLNIPQVIIRDKQKDYGTCNVVEGEYDQDDDLIIIDDVITTGGSISNVCDTLRKHNIKMNVVNVVVLCDRRDGKERDKYICGNVKCSSLFTIDTFEKYIKNIQEVEKQNLFFENSFGNSLYECALQKKSNIILSCDLHTTTEILELIKMVGKSIIGIKLHCDIIDDFSDDFIDKMKVLKNELKFIIIEDRKLGDINSIQICQLTRGVFKLSSWVDAVTIHGISGGFRVKHDDPILKTLPNLIMVAEMSSTDSQIDVDYIDKCLSLSEKNTHYSLESKSFFTTNVNALVCQDKTIKRMKNKYEYPTLSPGINLDEDRDNNGQTYSDFNKNKKGLFWIVGRGIYKSDNIINSMERYRESGWKYFLEW